MIFQVLDSFAQNDTIQRGNIKLILIVLSLHLRHMFCIRTTIQDHSSV